MHDHNVNLSKCTHGDECASVKEEGTCILKSYESETHSSHAISGCGHAMPCNAFFVRVCHALGYARTAITKYMTQFCLLSFVNLHTTTASAKVWVGGCTFRRKCLWLIRGIGLHLMVALFLQHVIHTLLFSDPVHTGVNTFWPNHRSFGFDSQCLLVLHVTVILTKYSSRYTAGTRCSTN